LGVYYFDESALFGSLERHRSLILLARTHAVSSDTAIDKDRFFLPRSSLTLTEFLVRLKTKTIQNVIKQTTNDFDLRATGGGECVALLSTAIASVDLINRIGLCRRLTNRPNIEN
jgi:hypothetical protein